MELTPDERAKRLKQHSYKEAFKDEMAAKKAKKMAGKIDMKKHFKKVAAEGGNPFSMITHIGGKKI